MDPDLAGQDSGADTSADVSAGRQEYVSPATCRKQETQKNVLLWIVLFALAVYVENEISLQVSVHYNRRLAD